MIAGGVLAAAVGGWWWYRHRRRQQEHKVRKAEVDKAEREGELEKRKKKEDEEEERKKTMRRRARRKGNWDSEDGSDWSDYSEDYDSVSDGGTIRPRRRRRRRRRDRGRRRHRRRRSYSDSEDSYESDETYVPRRKASRDRTPSPSPTPPPPVPRASKEEKKETNFRDSVFSSYHSMKNAAVKLEYVEAKVKLKKQLEEEERIDAHRKAKIAEANKELEASKRREQGLDSAGSSTSK